MSTGVSYDKINYQNINDQLNAHVKYREQEFSISRSGEEAQNNYVKYLTKLNFLLRGQTFFALAPTTPMAVRHEIVAHDRAHVVRVHRAEVDGKSVRIKNFMAATFGFAFTLTARIIRVAFRVLTSPFSLAVSAWQSSKYGKGTQYTFWEGRVGTDLKRIGYEFVDLATTFATPIIGIINTIAPEAINTDRLRDYYIDRMDRIGTKDAAFQTNENKYWAEYKHNIAIATATAAQAQRELAQAEASRVETVGQPLLTE